MNDSTLISEALRPSIDSYAFEIVPTSTGSFDPMLIDVPSTLGPDAAARRAYFSAMAMLAGRGFDVDDFEVNEWVGSDERGHSGRNVGPGGFATKESK